MPTSGLTHAKRISMDIAIVRSFYQPTGSFDCSAFFLPFQNASVASSRYRHVRENQRIREKKSHQLCQLRICHMWLHISDTAESDASNRILLGWVWRWVQDAGFGQGRSSRQEERLKRGIFLTKCNTDAVQPCTRRSCWSLRSEASILENISNQSGSSAAGVLQGRAFESGERKLQPCVVGHVIRALMRGRRPNGGGTGC